MSGALIPVFDFDIAWVKALNAFVGTWPLFDKIVWVLSSNPLFKGLVFVSLLWWLGMRAGDHQRTGFVFAVRWISGLFIALVVARFMQNLVPSHLRPISEPGLGLTAYKTSDMAYFARLYSFPSDHAIMFFGLATAIFTRSRRIGVCAFLWAAFIICLPRVYFGYHYPSDIFAGAILGVAIMGAALKARIPQYAVEGAHGLDQRAPGLAYAIAFLVSAEIAVNFDHVREVIVALGKATAG